MGQQHHNHLGTCYKCKFCKLHSRSIESETLGAGVSSNPRFHKPSIWFWCLPKFADYSFGASRAVLFNMVTTCGYLHLHYLKWNLKSSSLATLAIFQVLNNYMYLVATVLDGTNMEHFIYRRIEFYWTALVCSFSSLRLTIWDSRSFKCSSPECLALQWGRVWAFINSEIFYYLKYLVHN